VAPKSSRPWIEPPHGRCPGKEVRLPDGVETGPVREVLVDCLNNIKALEDCAIRFIAITQGLDTDQGNPASRFLLHVLGAAAEFERSLIRERTQACRLRYKQDFESGSVGKTVQSRSGRNLPPYKPRKIFDREEVIELRKLGFPMREIARRLNLGLGMVTRTVQSRFKNS